MDMDYLLQQQDKAIYTLDLIDKKLLSNISDDDKQKLIGYKKAIRNDMTMLGVKIDYALMYD